MYMSYSWLIRMKSRRVNILDIIKIYPDTLMCCWFFRSYRSSWVLSRPFVSIWKSLSWHLVGWNMKEMRMAVGWRISCQDSPASSLANVSKRLPTARTLKVLAGLINILTTWIAPLEIGTAWNVPALSALRCKVPFSVYSITISRSLPNQRMSTTGASNWDFFLQAPLQKTCS